MPSGSKIPNSDERAEARRQAVEIAQFLNSKVASHQYRVIGEPRCSYRVPFHKEDFWFKVLVSDADYIFAGEHRRRDAFRVPFSAALKHPLQIAASTYRLPGTSDGLGIDVYASSHLEEEAVSLRLLKSSIADLLRQINFSPIRMFFITSIQIHVISELISAERCVHQVRLLRELMLAIYHETHDAA